MATAPLGEVAAFLDQLLETERYRDEEPENGLLLTTGRPIVRIAAAVNTSLTSVRGAVGAQAQLLIVHHAHWQWLGENPGKQKEEVLLSGGVSLYCAHSSLDCASEVGTADSLARLLDVQVEGRFAPYGGGQAGVYGHVAGTFEDFITRCRDALRVPIEVWRNTQDFGHVGIVTGAGGMTDFMEDGQRRGCDTYITGEGSMYTKLFAREANMNLILGTHYATEAPGVKALAERTASQFGIPWVFIDEDPDVL